ncbi:MAG: hypothetical protein PVJ57_02350 [Phycisphaerae bacterium]|jgi:hypothetical protein
MNAGSPQQPRQLHPALRGAAALIGLIALIYLCHAGSLHYGLFMDDHVHFQQLRECDWSPAGLTGACRLELVGGIVDVWFLPDCTLRFFRPLAFGLMKLTYTLTGWDPVGMHAASLAWHTLVCILLMLLLRQLGAGALLAWGVAALFAVHPGHVATVQWIACQTELMGTAFILAAALCYLRFRGWSTEGDDNRSLRQRLPWAIACLLFFVAALGCRENTLLLPVVLVSVELLLWRRRRREIGGVYAAFALVAVAYLVLRWQMLGPGAVPPKPYVFGPTDAGFIRHVVDKACYYLLGEFLLVPCVPFAGLAYLRERPLVLYGLTLVVLAALVLIYWGCWRKRPGLLGPAWLFGFMLPVLPVFAAPHHLYMPGIGWAITVMLILKLIGGAVTRVNWRRQAAMWTSLILLGAALGAVTLSFGQALDAAQRVEDLVVDEVVANAPRLHDGDTLYFVNLPIIAYCVGPAVERVTGHHDLEIRPLTWAPRVLGFVGSDVDCEITWHDPRTFDVRLAGDRYFAGPLGAIVRAAGVRDAVPQTPASRDQHGFSVAVVAHEGMEVTDFRFTFERPLTDTDVHLYWGSRVLWAFELEPEATP